MLSVSSSSSRAPEIPPVASTASVPAPVSAPAPAIPSSAPSENDSQILLAVQTNTPTVSLDGPAPQETLPSVPAVSNTTPAPEPSAEPPSSNPPPVIASNDTPISQTATNIASTSKGPQNPAPAKGSRKKATKNPPKPKKMAPAKLVSDPVYSCCFTNICILDNCATMNGSSNTRKHRMTRSKGTGEAFLARKRR